MALEFDIYVYLNDPNLALDDRTATGVANAMRVSKDTAGEKLHKLEADGLLFYEPVGNSNVFFVRVGYTREEGSDK